MIRYTWCIDDIKKYQSGALPATAQKLDAPATINEMMIKSAPIAVAASMVLALTMFLKTFINKQFVVSLPAILTGALLGILLLVVHEWLHAIVYPRNATVTIGKLKGKMAFVALASFPLKRSRFIIMSLLPFLLGILPLACFIISSPQEMVFNGLMFGLACVGMTSPHPDVYNVILVLKQSQKADKIMFYGDDMYRVP